MSQTDKPVGIRKIEEDIRQLEKLKRTGVMPAALADASITALQAQMSASYQSQMQGDGASAQGTNSKAVGKQGVLVEGDFQGNIYIGEDPKEEEKQLAIYDRIVMQITASLPLRGVDVGASDPTQAQKSIGLANVYVDLDTTTPLIRADITSLKTKFDTDVLAERERRIYSVIEATLQNRHFVLLGDPGGGKSTFVNFLAYCLAAHLLEPKAGWLKHLNGWPQDKADLQPMVVILRDFARSYADALPSKAEPHHLWDFIKNRLAAQNLGFTAKPLEKALEAGKVIVMLDGLDEVPTQTQRVFVRDAVRAFIGRYPSNCFLITCRVLSYQPPEEGKPDLRLVELPSFEIAPFDDKKIKRFVGVWYAELVRLGTIKAQDQNTMTARLAEAVQRPDLKRLSPNPLLLTVMALVHTHKGRLPDARALLYEETVEILLWRWEQIKLGGQEDAPHLRQYLLEAGRTDVDLKRTLWKLAYEAHAASKPDADREALADIAEHDLEVALAALKPLADHAGGDRTWAMKIIEIMKLRSGLLLERQPGIFTFPHRTFQEYLAGAHLAAQPNFARCACELGRQGALWREVILYAVGKLVYVNGDLDKPFALVSEFCPVRAQDDQAAWRLAWLAGDALTEIGLNRVPDTQTGRDLLERVQTRLKNLLEAGALTPRERADSGNTLSALGDPRFVPERWFLPRDDLLGFVHVPSGKFIMGSDPKKDKDAKDFKERETPQHELELPDFWMAKYPVTLAQFSEFVGQIGYRFENSHWNAVANHPIVRVTWLDAIKYCEWLEGQLRVISKQFPMKNSPFWQGLAEGKLHVCLPSEAEWEKAARGINGRVYPWQGEFDPEKANTDETGIGDTNAVGCFPGGSSPYGLLDMSGNVWEWTRSLFTDYPYPDKEEERARRESLKSEGLRVIRGGSFSYSSWLARCAYRDWFNPGGWYADIGFRVVVSPAFLS